MEQQLFSWNASRSNPFARTCKRLCNANGHLQQGLVEERSHTAKDHTHCQVLETVRHILCMHCTAETAQMSICKAHIQSDTRRQANTDGIDDVVDLKIGKRFWTNIPGKVFSDIEIETATGATNRFLTTFPRKRCQRTSTNAAIICTCT